MKLIIPFSDLKAEVKVDQLAAKLVGGVWGTIEKNNTEQAIIISSNEREIKIALRLVKPYLAYWAKGD